VPGRSRGGTNNAWLELEALEQGPSEALELRESRVPDQVFRPSLSPLSQPHRFRSRQGRYKRARDSQIGGA
jgi:hypothetical protein